MNHATASPMPLFAPPHAPVSSEPRQPVPARLLAAARSFAGRRALVPAALLLGAAGFGLVLAGHGIVSTAGEAWLAAGLALVAGFAGHEARARRRHAAALDQELRRIREREAELTRELEMARTGVRLIRDSMEEARSPRQQLTEVANEVEVLQKLVEQLWSQRQGGRRMPAVPGIGTSHAAPRVAAGLDEAAILDLVRDGLSNGRVELHLQPIVSLPQRRRRFYECFSRIRAADGALIVPEQYLDGAAREGLAAAIDNMLLFRCIQVVRKARKKNPTVGFFCNISRHSLADHDFLRDFGDFLQQNADLAPSLIFEMAQADFEMAARERAPQLERLAELGLRFSVDRVSDLDLDPAQLLRHHVAFVKIDAARFVEVGENFSAPVHRLRRELARAGIDMIVEKIESEATLVELLEHAIDFGQGYAFGEPKPAEG